MGVESAEVLERLKKLGFEVKTASSSVDEDTADKLKRAFKIDQLTAKKKRVYGSDEDEAEREQEKEALAARIAAEREAREKAAAEAKEAQEARKSKRPARLTKAEKEALAKQAVAAEAIPPALLHAPGAPRLGKRVALPAVGALLLLGRPTIRILFEHGEYTAAAGDLTYRVLVAYAVALPSYVATEVVTRGLIALRDTRTPLFTNSGQLVLRVLLISLLIDRLGVVSIPVAFAISATLETLILAAVLLSKLRRRLVAAQP